MKGYASLSGLKLKGSRVKLSKALQGDHIRLRIAESLAEHFGPRIESAGKCRGVFTGCTLLRFWAGLFQHNLKCKKADRLTDREILNQVAEEFPRCLAAQTADLFTVSEMRGRFNRGKLPIRPPKGRAVKPYDGSGETHSEPVRLGRRFYAEAGMLNSTRF